MQSKATTVKQYLGELPADRRAALSKVRAVIRKHLPKGYAEVMNWGMITYEVPLATHPDTYNGQPLMYAALASQKNHMAVYLSGIYADEGGREEFEAAYRDSGKRFDVGKSCVRFRDVDDLPLPLIGKAVAAMTPAEFIEVYEAAREGARRKKA
jgi:uncharacterized protein YdhG (YjbR/CyaY superfamily)